MSKNIIYCYSGTGNCLFWAKRIAQHLEDTDIVMMRKHPTITDTKGAERVGFIFPCYAGGLPGDVETFVREIKIEPKTYTFGLVSYAGYPGIGLAKIGEIHRLDYFAGISHHCSCIWLLPHNLTIPPLSVQQSQKRFERKAVKVASDIKAKKKINKNPSKPAINRIEAEMGPKLIHLKAKKFTVSENCIACGQCVSLCPRGNIHIIEGKACIGTNCLGCLSCLQYCPKEAINIGNITKKRERYRNPYIKSSELIQDIIHID